MKILLFCSYVLEFVIQLSHRNPELCSFPTRRSSDLISTLSHSPASIAMAAMRASAMNDDPPNIVLSENRGRMPRYSDRSEEHTSELQSRGHLVCRLLLEKKKYNNKYVSL